MKYNIVLNSSPIIVLFKAEMEYILPRLFNKIVIPENVIKEISIGKDRAANEIKNTKWYETHSISINENILEWNLGRGESAVLSFAYKNKEFKAVIDDAAARRCANTFDIRFLGTGSILALAAREGIIESFDRAISKIKDAGLWISDDVIILLKKNI